MALFDIAQDLILEATELAADEVARQRREDEARAAAEHARLEASRLQQEEHQKEVAKHLEKLAAEERERARLAEENAAKLRCEEESRLRAEAEVKARQDMAEAEARARTEVEEAERNRLEAAQLEKIRVEKAALLHKTQEEEARRRRLHEEENARKVAQEAERARREQELIESQAVEAAARRQLLADKLAKDEADRIRRSEETRRVMAQKRPNIVEINPPNLDLAPAADVTKASAAVTKGSPFSGHAKIPIPQSISAVSTGIASVFKDASAAHEAPKLTGPVEPANVQKVRKALGAAFLKKSDPAQ